MIDIVAFGSIHIVKFMFWLLGFGTQNHAEYSSQAQKQKIYKKPIFSKMKKKIKKIETVWLQKTFRDYPKKIWWSYDKNCDLCFVLTNLG